jgi:hypothetical protein
MAVPKKTPSLWQSDGTDNTKLKTDNAKLKQELADCEKEKRSLSALIVHIGETVMQHVKKLT